MKLFEESYTYVNVIDREDLKQSLTLFKQSARKQGWTVPMYYTKGKEQISPELTQLVGLDYKVETVSIFQDDFPKEEKYPVLMPNNNINVIKLVEESFSYPLIIKIECSPTAVKCHIQEETNIH